MDHTEKKGFSKWRWPFTIFTSLFVFSCLWWEAE